MTKLPIGLDGRPANVADENTWTSFERAIAKLHEGEVAGIGFVFTRSDPYVGFDLDDAVQSECLEPWARDIVDTLCSYTEYSPSRQGLHIICRGRLLGQQRRRGNVEIYDQSRYFTVTGEHLAGTPLHITDGDAAIERVYRRYVSAPTAYTLPLPTPSPLRSDEALVERMLSSQRGAKISALWRGELDRYDMDHSVADLALCCYLAYWCDRDPSRMDRLFRMSGLMRRKWDQRRGQSTYGERTILKALQ